MAKKSKVELEKEADRIRKAEVDAHNKKVAEKARTEAEKMANIPLTDEERAFIAEIEPKMKEGRKIMQPSSAQILRYSKLIKRKDVK